MDDFVFEPSSTGRSASFSRIDFCNIYLDGERVGVEYTRYPKSFLDDPVTVYYISDAKRTQKEADAVGTVESYYFDEYDWGDGEWDAWFPTFDNLNDFSVAVRGGRDEQ